MAQNKYHFFYSFCFFFLCIFTMQVTAFAAMITVDRADDSILEDDECSLREAIINANDAALTHNDCTAGTDDSVTVDAIDFDTSVTTVCMDDTATGALAITRNLTITGNATNGTTIDGTDETAGGTTSCLSDYQGPLFNIAGAGIEVTLDHLIIKNGYHDVESGGGIIVNTDATLNLTNSTVSNNTAASDYAAGGIYSTGTLNITNSTISDNDADSYGGGIYSTGTLTVMDSTISDNDNIATEGAGGIACDGTTTIINSIISGNTSTSLGGGVYNFGALTINNSTISDNSATTTGGAIISTNGSEDAVLNIANSTIANNSSGIISGAPIIDHEFVTSIFKLKNSILADNGSLDCMGIVDSFGYNVIENYLDYEDGFSIANSTGCTLLYSNSGVDSDLDFINQAITLDALADNGGATFTQALSTDDIAIDNGNCAGIDGVADTDVTTDQRGLARDANCDIGAFEYQAVCGDDLTSDGEECDDGNTDSNDGCSATCQTEATWYADTDGDGYGDLDSSTQAVDAPADFVADSTDCDDTNDTIHPDATETCGDTIDQDCNSEDLTCDTDTDGDGTPDVDDDDDDNDGIPDDEDDSPTGDDDDDGADGFTEAGGCGLNAKAGKVDSIILSFVAAFVFLATRLRLRQNFSNPT